MNGDTTHTLFTCHFFFDTLFLHKFFLLTKEITNRRNYLPTCVLIRFYLSRMVGISYVSCAVSVSKWMSCLVLIEWQQWCHSITYNTIDSIVALTHFLCYYPHQLTNFSTFHSDYKPCVFKYYLSSLTVIACLLYRTCQYAWLPTCVWDSSTHSDWLTRLALTPSLFSVCWERCNLIRTHVWRLSASEHDTPDR